MLCWKDEAGLENVVIVQNGRNEAVVLRTLKDRTKGLTKDRMHDCICISPVADRGLDVLSRTLQERLHCSRLLVLAVSLVTALSFSAICFWRAMFWALKSLSSFSSSATLAGSVSKAVSLARISSSCVLMSQISAIAAADLLFLPEGAIVLVYVGVSVIS
jgi:hypothetical protein